MRKPFLAAAIALTISTSAYGQAARAVSKVPVKPSARLQLRAQVEPASSKLGTPVFVKLQLQNVHFKTVELGETDGYTDFEIAVTDVSGREPALTQFGKDLPESPIFRAVPLSLKPGESVQVVLEVTKIYQLEIGAYYLRAARRSIGPEFAAEQGKISEKAFSNPVAFSVVR